MVSNKNLSEKFNNLIGSEIIRLSREINKLIKEGHKIYNLTIGDFDPAIYPIPKKLLKLIKKNYQYYTNYPDSQGDLELRKLLSMKKSNIDISYNEKEILISNGARSLIYAIFQAIVDPGEKVIYSIPSWNNNHYTYLVQGKAVEIQTQPENNFLLTVDDLKKCMTDNVVLISLCSPQNPTGTEFDTEQLNKIFEYICNINKERTQKNLKPVYILFDNIYSELSNNQNEKWRIEGLKDYLFIIDGVSKNMAATGLRIGWCYSNEFLCGQLKKFLSHIGAWAPHPEQVALRKYFEKFALKKDNKYSKSFHEKIKNNLEYFYEKLVQLKDQKYPIDVIKPTGAIYLTVKIDLINKEYQNKKIKTIDEITEFLIKEANIALVPFKAFGVKNSEPWFRLSIGTIKKSDIKPIVNHLKQALDKLNDKE